MSDRRPIKNSIGFGLAAFIMYGSWAFYANSAFGVRRALVAALVQGCASFTVTFLMTEAMHAMERRFGRTRWALIATAVVPVSLANSAVAAAHAIVGTPAIVRTITPSIVVGVIYCSVYTAHRARRDHIG